MTQKNFLPRLAFAFALSLWWTGGAAQAADDQVSFDAREDGKIAVKIGDEQVALYVYNLPAIFRAPPGARGAAGVAQPSSGGGPGSRRPPNLSPGPVDVVRRHQWQ